MDLFHRVFLSKIIEDKTFGELVTVFLIFFTAEKRDDICAFCDVFPHPPLVNLSLLSSHVHNEKNSTDICLCISLCHLALSTDAIPLSIFFSRSQEQK